MRNRAPAARSEWSPLFDFTFVPLVAGSATPPATLAKPVFGLTFA